MPELFSVNEAAAIAEVSPNVIRTALEKKAVTPSRSQRVGKAFRHHFSVSDVLFVKLLVEFPFPLSKRDKQSLAQILARRNKKAAPWSLQGNDLIYRSGEMRMAIECKSLWQTVAKNLAAYRRGTRRIVSSPDVLGGETVFRGTRVPVKHVASLFRRGVSDSEIAEDFPALSSRDLAYARLVSRFGERPGRPRKRLPFKRERRVDG
jgi:uncharacterized protein (DUF433 family)